ncbi:MAG TPA: tetratricopeptide repeat protein [Polyangiaceae bacterium]|nr:tetratricopeptide repeat protein [Polyangiaceae bacterium]
MSQAVLLADKGRSAEALRLIEEHLAEHPDAVAERRLAVRLAGATGDLGRASTHASALERRLGPTSPVPLLELGHAFELAHRYDEALLAYDRAGVVAPNDAAGPRTGGFRAAAWGELELAEPRLSEAVRRNPNDGRAWHALGVVRARLGRLDAAEAAYTSGLSVDPDGVDNRIGLATVSLLRDDPRGVLREYDALLARHPEVVDAHLGRSWALIRLARYDEAEDALRRAESLGADREVVTRQRKWLRRSAEHGTHETTRSEGVGPRHPARLPKSPTSP